MKAQSKAQTSSTATNVRYICIGLLIIILQAIFHLSVDMASAKATNHTVKASVLKSF